MQIDLSLVVYRPNEDLLAATLTAIGNLRREVRLVRLLVSGSNDELNAVGHAVQRAGLEQQVVLTHRYDNLGFASGHNLLLGAAFTSGADAVLIVNPDMEIEEGSISDLASAAVSESRPALYGPIIRRVVEAGSPSEIDSAGVVWTVTGRHFDHLQGKADIDADRSQNLVEGLTGACLFVTRAAHSLIHSRSGYFFDDLFVAYREDAELGIRASLIGVPSICVNVPGFFHVRSVRGATRGNVLADLLGVRNRFIMKRRMLGLRPGLWLLAGFRDCMVVAGTLIQERSSLPGLLSVFKMRRYIRYTSPYRSYLNGEAA